MYSASAPIQYGRAEININQGATDRVAKETDSRRR